MFKLINLSSPTGLFHTIEFKDGLNIILGMYENKGNDINGIGKTSIVNLIDYCLLADGPKKILFENKFSFLKNHTIRLKFNLSGIDIEIMRDFKRRDIAYFSENGGVFVEYSDGDLRVILGRYFGSDRAYPGTYSVSWFRTLMNFFVQDDHSYQARDSDSVENFLPGMHSKAELLAYNLFIAGISNNDILRFDIDRKELKQLQGDKNRIEKQVVQKTGKSVDEFRCELDRIQDNISSFEIGLNEFDFGANYKSIEDSIESISAKISSSNKEHLAIKRKLSQIRSSTTFGTDFDVDRIKQLYDDLSQQFGQFIKRELSDVLNFRKEISSNRSMFLSEREGKYIAELLDIESKVLVLEGERSSLYKKLDEINALDAVKSAYLNLMDERVIFSEKKTYINQIDQVEIQIENKKAEVTTLVEKIIDSNNLIVAKMNDLQKVFMDIVKNSVNTTDVDVIPYFGIEVRKNSASPMNIRIDVPRSGSLGKGRFKILAYDLTLFLHSCLNNRSLPRFLIHDGVFHGIAHKTRINLLNYLNEYFDKNKNIQYIITINEDEVTLPEGQEQLGIKLNFNLINKSIVILKDDPAHMFFGSEFG